VLAEFTQSTDGRLSGSVYDTVRCSQRRSWPQRDTLARYFGSWYGALEAAGLAERAAAPRRVRERAAFDLLRVEQRERVLASVRRFIAEVGHVPRAMEYFRWRLERDPQTPTQATVYNLFPGGWNAVREALVC
jgi:hypothetical protein